MSPRGLLWVARIILVSLIYITEIENPNNNISLLPFVAVNFDHFQILRAIGKGSFGKVSKRRSIGFADKFHFEW